MRICALTAILLHAPQSSAYAAEVALVKCGVIDAENVLKNSLLSTEAKQRLEKEFKSRDEALQRRAKELRRLEYQQDVAKDAKDEAKAQRIQQELDQVGPGFQGDANEFRRDLAKRRDEELKVVIKATEAAYKTLAAQEAYQKIYQTSEAEPIFFVPEARQSQCSTKKDISADIIRIMDFDTGHSR